MAVSGVDVRSRDTGIVDGTEVEEHRTISLAGCKVSRSLKAIRGVAARCG